MKGLAALALVVAAVRPAGAAVKISAGQELIYSGTASWKITATAGPSQTITGPIGFTALVSEADPGKGFSVILMRRFQQNGKPGLEQNQSDVELATLQFGPDLARTGLPERPTGPISVVMQAIRLPFAPRADVNSGQVWRRSEALPAMPSGLLEMIYTVGGQAKVGKRNGIKIEKRLAKPLPFKQDLNGRTITLKEYGETITVDPDTGQVLSDELREKLEYAAGNQKMALDLAAAATLQETRGLSAPELASRQKQAAAIEHLQTNLFTYRPGDEGKKILAGAAKEAAAFRSQFADSPYGPAVAHLEEIRTQIQAELERQSSLPGQKG